MKPPQLGLAEDWRRGGPSLADQHQLVRDATGAANSLLRCACHLLLKASCSLQVAARCAEGGKIGSS